LQSTSDEKTSERGPVGEELHIRFGFVLVLVGDAVLDLVEFSTYPRIGFVSIRVKACECLETFVWTTMVYEPLTNS